MQDGGAAQLAYLEAIAIEARKEELRAKLLAYCERDTLAMVEVEKALYGGAREPTPA